MPEDRLETLYAYIKDDPSDPFLYYAIAMEQLRREQPLEALAQFEYLIANHPTYLGTYYHLGKLLEKLGRKEEAIDYYRAGGKIADDQRERNARRELQQALDDAIAFDE
jgi:tetratricopeptide (TPR) repeat protein